MRTQKLATALLAFVLLAATAPVNGAVVIQAETVGTATNNTTGTAQAIPGSAFTTPVPATVFSPPGWATATILGTGGGSDVDFFSFSTAGGGALFDMDNNPFTFDTIVSLFDAAGTLIAFDDDSFPVDPGTVNGYDAFLGAIVLAPGTYFVAITQFSNFPTAITGGGLGFTPLTRPDGEFGGNSVSGATLGDSSFGSSGIDPGSGYTLHVSLQNPGANVVPEPSSLLLCAVFGVAGVANRIKRRRQLQRAETV